MGRWEGWGDGGREGRGSERGGWRSCSVAKRMGFVGSERVGWERGYVSKGVGFVGVAINQVYVFGSHFVCVVIKIKPADRTSWLCEFREVRAHRLVYCLSSDKVLYIYKDMYRHMCLHKSEQGYFYKHEFPYMFLHIYINAHISICISIHLYIYLYIYICICMERERERENEREREIDLHIYMYTYIYIQILMYIYIYGNIYI